MVDFLLMLLLVLVVIGLPTFGVFAGYKSLIGYFFKRRCRKLAENNDIVYDEPSWWQMVVSEQRGTLRGRYRGMPLRLELKERSYALLADGEGQLPDGLTIQRQGLLESFLPTLISSLRSLKDVTPSAFQQHYKIDGPHILQAAMLDQQARDNIIHMGRFDTPMTFSMWLRDGHLELRSTRRDNGRYKPEEIVHHAQQLYRSWLLPKDHEERRLALAERLAQQFRESNDPHHQLQLGTAHLETYPDLLEQTGMMELLASSTEPALMWLLTRHNALASRDFQEVADLACLEHALRELRIAALDLLAEHAPLSLQYQTFSTCANSQTMLIRRNAKKRLKAISAQIDHDARAGQLSVIDVDDDTGKLSITADEGGLSLTKD